MFRVGPKLGGDPGCNILNGGEKSIPFDVKKAALFVGIILTDLPRELRNETVSQKK